MFDLLKKVGNSITGNNNNNNNNGKQKSPVIKVTVNCDEGVLQESINYSQHNARKSLTHSDNEGSGRNHLGHHNHQQHGTVQHKIDHSQHNAKKSLTHSDNEGNGRTHHQHKTAGPQHKVGQEKSNLLSTKPQIFDHNIISKDKCNDEREAEAYRRATSNDCAVKNGNGYNLDLKVNTIPHIKARKQASKSWEISENSRDDFLKVVHHQKTLSLTHKKNAQDKMQNMLEALAEYDHSSTLSGDDGYYESGGTDYLAIKYH